MAWKHDVMTGLTFGINEQHVGKEVLLIWLESLLEPCSLDWEMRNGTLALVLTVEDPAPKELLKFLHCKCRISTKSPWSTNICYCRKHGLTGLTPCNDCRSTDCSNISLVLHEEDKWEDNAMLFEILFYFILFTNNVNGLKQAICIVLFAIFSSRVGRISINVYCIL